MEQLPRFGFVTQRGSGLVFHLNKSFYGLKELPQACLGNFSQVVKAFRMILSKADYLVFYQHSSSNLYIFLVVYVNDIVITGNDHVSIDWLKWHLFQNFQTNG